MDNTQIINLLVTALITMMTTAVVTRLSLNQGRLGLTSQLKQRFTPIVKAYLLLIFCLGVCIYFFLRLYWFINDPTSETVTRGDVLFIAATLILFCIWCALAGVAGANLVYRYLAKKAH